MNQFYLLNDYNISLESDSESESYHSECVSHEIGQNNGLKDWANSGNCSERLQVALDLDRTLIYSSFTAEIPYDFFIDVETPNGIKPVYVTKRPHLDSFLDELTQIADVCIFTAAETKYAQEVVKVIDPTKRFISRFFFRNHCIYRKPNIYIKDLSCIGTPMGRTVLVDDSMMSFGGRYENAIKVRPFSGDQSDRELDGVLALVKQINTMSDVRPYLMKLNAQSLRRVT